MTTETISSTNSTMAALGAGLLSISAVGFLWYRRIKLDSAESIAIDRILNESAKAAEMWRLNAEEANKRADEANRRADDIQKIATETIDKFAKERNEAVQEFGKLQATVEHLQETIEEFKRENKSLNQKIDRLMETYGVSK